MRKLYTLLFLFAFTCSFAQLDGTWKMSNQAAALGVGPMLGDISWWSNSEADLTTRACYFDDKYVFNEDGSFNNVMDNETWIEEWQSGVPEACGTPLAPFDGSNAATWNYNAGAGTFTLNGVGAYIGLPKVINEGEIDDPADAVESITYPVEFSADGDTMTINISIGGGFWRFILAKVTGTSVQELEKDMFSIYPNPATSEVLISSDQRVDEITVFDFTGKTLLMKMNPSMQETLDVSNYARGIYFVQSRVGDQRITQKLILK